MPITLDGTDGVPARSIIAISGLPQGSTLSTGRPYGESEWNLKTDEIGDLQLVLPYTASGVAKLIFQLVAPDGAIIADAATVINMRPNPRANASASNINPEFTQVEVRAQGPEATGVAESPANLAAALAGDPVPLPSRRPTPTTNHADSTKWIKPSTFVNLREGPSPSSRVISVVPKGAKLHVMGRKNVGCRSPTRQLRRRVGSTAPTSPPALISEASQKLAECPFLALSGLIVVAR